MASIQLISKTNYAIQTVVPLPLPSTPLLAPDTIRIRSRILGLTTNLLKCAKLGAARLPGLDWYNIWPFPFATAPEPFNDPSKYCRIGAWGYSEVVESTIPSLTVGTFLYGYQPIGSVPEELKLKAVDDVPGGWVEISERRKDMVGIYNFYLETETDDENDRNRESKGWDALMQPLFCTSWMLNRFVFDWTGEESNRVHPLGVDSDLPWTKEDANLKGATVILLAASAKTGLAFAQQLRHGRPEFEQPSKIVAVGSEDSKAFTASTGWFDEILGYHDVDDAPGLLLDSGNKPAKVLLVDFGARGGAADRWATALRPMCERLQVVLLGADPSFNGQIELLSLARQPGSGVTQSNAGRQWEMAREMLGARKYTDEFAAAWNAFKAEGAVKGLNLVWGRGIDGFKEGWDVLARGEGRSDVGLVYGRV
ncbi:hypothetical protein QBC47DRAFT_395627 [Echria macrotheca]|uniref:Uncharacterized protein n=1 Tax=Echria macrotheca TaxID=438768 RepID=A0AAJ0F5X9_9PEZI|nr:hypothetical protein QBC47DRAFT_395627 [Echria macrotheca]